MQAVRRRAAKPQSRPDRRPPALPWTRHPGSLSPGLLVCDLDLADRAHIPLCRAPGHRVVRGEMFPGASVFLDPNSARLALRSSWGWFRSPKQGCTASGGLSGPHPGATAIENGEGDEAGPRLSAGPVHLARATPAPSPSLSPGRRARAIRTGEDCGHTKPSTQREPPCTPRHAPVSRQRSPTANTKHLKAENLLA